MVDSIYVHRDENEVYRVGDTRVMLDSVVASFQLGHSAETIQQQYPALSLEDVYGAITFYLANQSEVDAYLHRQAQVWQLEREAAGTENNPVVQRLRDRMTAVGRLDR